jgi:hypothetical protein
VAADAGIDCDLQAAEASIHPRDNAIMSEPRLEHQNIKVKQLIDDYRPGRFA